MSGPYGSPTGEPDAGELLLSMTSQSTRTERSDFPSMRRFTADLALERFNDDTFETATVTDLANCDVVLFSCKYGLQSAHLDADAEDGSLAAVMEELLELDRRRLLSRWYPALTAVVIVDAIEVLPAAADGAANVELAMLAEVADYFAALPGQPLLVVFPSPRNAEQLDQFTLRSQCRRIEALLPQLGLNPFMDTGAWAAAITALPKL